MTALLCRHFNVSPDQVGALTWGQQAAMLALLSNERKARDEPQKGSSRSGRRPRARRVG